jgi:hypothetical protein
MAKLNERQIFEALDLIYKTKDRDGLHAFIKDTFGVHLARKSFCNGHTSPFTFFADCFFGEDEDGEEVTDVIYVANRTSGKTLMFALLNAINAYYWNDCEVASLGAIEAQALKCYNYFKRWYDQVIFLRRKVAVMIQSMTRLTNNSVVQVLIATMSGVNSPHPQKAEVDEVELIQWTILQEAFSMAISKVLPDGRIIRAQTILTSSRKFAHGPMERLLKEAKERGFKVYMTCIMESVAPHDPVECAGSDFAEDCQGRCAEYEGHLLLPDVIKVRKRLDRNTWRAQWKSERPSPEGLVYPMYEPFRHCYRHIDPIYSLPLYLAEDFGFASGHANVVGFFQLTLTGKKLLLSEIWVEGKTDSEIILLVEGKLLDLGFVDKRFDYRVLPKEQQESKRKEWLSFFTTVVRAWYCPPEEPSKIHLRAVEGYRVLSQNDPAIRKIEYGLPLIRRDLESDNFEMDVSCIGCNEEMGTYPNVYNKANGTYDDRPEKINDNGPDMIRYFYINYQPTVGSNSIGKTRDDTDSGMITAGIDSVVF